MIELEKLMLTSRGVRANVSGQVFPNHDRIAQNALWRASWDDRTLALCLFKCGVLFFLEQNTALKMSAPAGRTTRPPHLPAHHIIIKPLPRKEHFILTPSGPASLATASRSEHPFA